jgi:hypothetical protein
MASEMTCNVRVFAVEMRHKVRRQKHPVWRRRFIIREAAEHVDLSLEPLCTEGYVGHCQAPRSRARLVSEYADSTWLQGTEICRPFSLLKD